MKHLIDEVKERLLKEGLSYTELQAITGLSKATVQRFMNGDLASERTKRAMRKYVENKEDFSANETMVNIGQVKIPQRHYDYVKRYADTNGVSMAEVFRKMVADVVDHELLWKGLNDYMEITERAVSRVLSNRIIPFIKIQDEHIKNMEIELKTTKYLAMDSVRETSELSDDEVFNLMKAYEGLSKDDYRDIYYNKKNDEDDEVL